jgi:secondary thiamine-phosphate synthase enzyme
MREALDPLARDSSAGSRVVPLRNVRAPLAQFAVYSETLEYATEHALQFIDITEDVRGILERSGVAAGTVSIVSTHTTAAVILNEHEPLLLNDMARVLSRLVPAGDYYEHNDFSIRTVNVAENEPANGHAHCQHLFLGTSETIPVQDGRLVLGRWQSVFLVELDHARPRAVLVQAMGLAAGD